MPTSGECEEGYPPVDTRAMAPEAPASTTADSEVEVIWGVQVTVARVLAATPQMLLVEGERPLGRAFRVGYPVRIRQAGGSNAAPGRLAAVGQGQRYLLSLGSRAVRGAARQRVDLPGVVRTARLAEPAAVRVIDLSTSGAAVYGGALPVGTECLLTFVPPGRPAAVTLRCLVVRAQHLGALSTMGVAFCGTALAFGRDRDAAV